LLVKPLVNGKLNAKALVGSPEKLRDLQNAFYKEVASKFDLERGVAGSRASHEDIKKYYQRVKRVEGIKLPKPKTKKILGVIETEEKASEYLHRIQEPVKDAMALYQEATTKNKRLEKERLALTKRMKN